MSESAPCYHCSRTYGALQSTEPSTLPTLAAGLFHSENSLAPLGFRYIPIVLLSNTSTAANVTSSEWSHSGNQAAVGREPLASMRRRCIHARQTGQCHLIRNDSSQAHLFEAAVAHGIPLRNTTAERSGLLHVPPAISEVEWRDACNLGP